MPSKDAVVPRRGRRTAMQAVPMGSRLNESEDFRVRQQITDQTIRALPGLHHFGRKKRKPGSAAPVSK